MVDHVHVCNGQKHPHREGFGCVCACGAVYHWLGWQEIKTLPAPPEPLINPCAVVIMDDGEFDVEEYRVDLQRRYDSLNSMAAEVRERWNQHADNTNTALTDRDSMNRLSNKAAGLRIALDLLPRKVVSSD